MAAFLVWAFVMPSLAIYNGTGNTVFVQVGDEELQLAPYRAEVLDGQMAGPVLVEARPAFLDEPLERYEVELTWGGETTLVNLGGRAVLSRDFVVYSEDPNPRIPDSEALGRTPIQQLGRVDYLFETPPKEKQISGDRVVNDTIEDLGRWSTHTELIDQTIELEGQAAGFELALAAALWDPQSVQSSVQLATFFDDADQLSEAVGELDPHPALHRAWQDLAARDDYEAVQRRYREQALEQGEAWRLALASRVATPGSEEGLSLAAQAMEQDPRHPWAHSEMAWHLAHAGRPAEAAERIKSWMNLVDKRTRLERYDEGQRYAMAADDPHLALTILKKAQTPDHLGPDWERVELQARLEPRKREQLIQQLLKSMAHQGTLASWPTAEEELRASVCMAGADLECADFHRRRLASAPFTYGDLSLLIALSDDQELVSVDEGLRAVADLDHRALVLAAAAAIRDGHPLEQQLRQATFDRTALWPMLDQEVPIEDPELLDQWVVAGASPEDWGHCYGAAALLLEAQGQKGSEAWVHARSQAMRWWLPGEGPVWTLPTP